MEPLEVHTKWRPSVTLPLAPNSGIALAPVSAECRSAALRSIARLAGARPSCPSKCWRAATAERADRRDPRPPVLQTAFDWRTQGPPRRSLADRPTGPSGHLGCGRMGRAADRRSRHARRLADENRHAILTKRNANSAPASPFSPSNIDNRCTWLRPHTLAPADRVRRMWIDRGRPAGL